MSDALGFDRSRLGRLDAVLHRYVDESKLPGTLVQIARHGEIVHHDVYGWADVEAGKPLRDDSIFRIYSMTKPIVSVALMMLFEEGELLLDNRVSRFIPEFAEPRVFVGGDPSDPQTEPARREINLRDLLSHQGGLTAGFMGGPVARIYLDNKLGDLVRNPEGDLAAVAARVGQMPLIAHPGDRWAYSMSTDVAGRVIEVVSGQTLDVFLRERLFEPLGMVDTGFHIPDEKADRLASCYVRTLTEVMRPLDAGGPGSARTRLPKFLSGGGGLLSTVADYHRFTEMLRLGGALDGERLLSPRTIELMRSNHLPGGRALGTDATVLERASDGVGFGLGFATVIDQAAAMNLGSKGEYYWGGAASTAFWIDPVDDVTVIFMTQLMPSSTYPIRPQLRAGVYQALID